MVAGALDDLRERFRRVQLVFDGDAPEPAFRTPGVMRVRRQGRVLTVLSSAGADRLLDEARALSPSSVDVVPVTLKEIFLETVDSRRTDMLWHKAWLDTRWRFLIGLVLLTIMACGVIVDYPLVEKLMPAARGLGATVDTTRPLGRLIKEGIAAQSSYRGFVWWQGFRQNLTQGLTLFAVLLGSGGLLAHGTGGGALFTLSMPASRNRLLVVRTATGLAELVVLALVPSLVIPLFSPGIGQTYSLVDTIVHGMCLFVGAAAFFSLAVLLSTMFTDVWRPMLIACGVAIVLALAEPFVADLPRVTLFRVMSGETYFRSGALPWPGLAIAATVSAALLYLASIGLSHRDF